MIDALFGSKTRVKLLHLFLNNPGRAFYVREITRKIDEQINSVRRELANMLSIGVIQSDENSDNSNKLYYEVNTHYTFYEPLRLIFADKGSKDHVGSALAANDVVKRASSLGDVRIVLFAGQLVHGSNSSVDVVIAGDVNKSSLKRFIKELESEESKTLTYTLLSYEDFYYRLSIKDKFVMELLSTKHTAIVDSEQILSTNVIKAR